MNGVASGARIPARHKTAVLVAHALAKRVARLEPGDQLPPERVLIEELGVARNTAREALRLLEIQGVITIKAGPGGGPIVARPDHRPLAYSLSLALQGTDATFSDLLRARSVIESEMAERAAERRSAEQVAELNASNERMKALLDDEEAFLRENLIFHDLCAKAAGNRILQLFHASLKEISDGHSVGVAFTAKQRAAVLVAHERVAAAIAAGDPAMAREAMQQHMGEAEAYIRRRYPEQLRKSIQWMLDDSA